MLPTKIYNAKRKSVKRSLKQKAEKALDAPDLLKKLEYNLVDWGNNNNLAICLSKSLYIYDVENYQPHELYDSIATMGDNDFPTSVKWIKSKYNSNCVAVGYING